MVSPDLHDANCNFAINKIFYLHSALNIVLIIHFSDKLRQWGNWKMESIREA